MRKPSLSSVRHARPVQPLVFPESNEEWHLGQSLRHLHLCELLRAILRAATTRGDSVGADQFVYFDASNPRRCLAPDGFVKLGVPQDFFDSWKAWERGAPELAVEILSPSDTREPLSLEQKVERYGALGVRELACFDADARRIRAWDRIEGELVERAITPGAGTPCIVLGAQWVLAPGAELPVALRLVQGGELVLTGEERALAAKERAIAAKEAERAAKEAERAAKEAERAAKEAECAAKEAECAAKEAERAAKDRALAEVVRLRALLAERGGGS